MDEWTPPVALLPDLTSLKDVIKFAADAHRGQRRKYIGTPYIEHPLAVAELVRKAGGHGNAISAALLHDVVEDCDVTLLDIFHEFGDSIANAVYFLTDDERGDRNRREHKIDLARRFSHAPKWVRMVKVADMIDNTQSIVQYDPDFAKVYMAEKAYLLQHLVPCNDDLVIVASFIIHMYNPDLLLAAIDGASYDELKRISIGGPVNAQGRDMPSW